MTESASRGRGRPRDPAVEAAILRAAFDLFLERGADGTSIEQVAKRAGVGKLTVYRRWATKEELLAGAIEVVLQERDWPDTEQIATGTPAEVVERFLPTAAEVTASPRFRALVSRVYGCAVSHPALMATYWRHYIQPRRAATFVMLRHAQQAGTVPADADLDVVIDMIAGAVTYRVLQPNPPDVAEMRRYLEAIYRQAGLLPPR
ncbi:TetR/AcrR family transcriptional regulator [Actinophytocola sediminis]